MTSILIPSCKKYISKIITTSGCCDCMETSVKHGHCGSRTICSNLFLRSYFSRKKIIAKIVILLFCTLIIKDNRFFVKSVKTPKTKTHLFFYACTRVSQKEKGGWLL